jgi:hypothetical protein
VCAQRALYAQPLPDDACARCVHSSRLRVTCPSQCMHEHLLEEISESCMHRLVCTAYTSYLECASILGAFRMRVL